MYVHISHLLIMFRCSGLASLVIEDAIEAVAIANTWNKLLDFMAQQPESIAL